ncbi:MAG: DNA double-strand break repair nuclease NurA [Candidatus Caldarchaeum sp.]
MRQKELEKRLASADQIPDFLKIPKPLQEKFFAAALEEANSLIGEISQLSQVKQNILNELSQGISVFDADKIDWQNMLVAVVDGSDVPALDDRIGLRYGLYAVAYKLFRGIDVVENGEGYFGDRLPGKISMHRETFLKNLDLVTTYYERFVANELLKTVQPDMVMVDGSFFGYRAGCSIVKKESIMWTDPLTEKKFETVYELIDEINRLTMVLVESGKAFGVIKRLPTSAIDGYLLLKYGVDRGLELSDRSILSLVMKQGEVFDYEKIFGPDLKYDVLTMFRTSVRDKSMANKPVSEILKNAERRVKVQLVADLTDWTIQRGQTWRHYIEKPVIQAVRSTKRYFLKTVEDLPPVCVEFSEKSSRDFVEKALAYVFKTANPATGLPLALDVVDELVSLPRGIGKEFINEIEAELLRRGLSKQSLLAVFTRYNQQKDEP